MKKTQQQIKTKKNKQKTKKQKANKQTNKQTDKKIFSGLPRILIYRF